MEAAIKLPDTINRCALKIEGLGGFLAIRVGNPKEGGKRMPITADEIAKGIDLANLLELSADTKTRDVWKLIAEKNGLISFIVHPDYVVHDEVKSLYKDLLKYLRELQATTGIWVTLPSEVNRWWRARSKIQVVPSGNEWRIEGEGAERAVLAYARNADGKLIYEDGTGAEGNLSPS